MLERALNEVGAARSIVIDEHGVILAGNATVEAAQQAGIERVRVVEADGNEIIAVQRRGLTPEQKTKLALYDNRVAELAEWEPGVLAGFADRAVDMSTLFTDTELASIVSRAPLELVVDSDVEDRPTMPDLTMPDLQPSYVRMVQLFLTSETQPEFLRMVKDLMPRVGQTTITDTVMEVVRYAYRTLNTPNA